MQVCLNIFMYMYAYIYLYMAVPWWMANDDDEIFGFASAIVV